MYIEPNSTIHILKSVPLDNTYEHTINFGSASSQYSYFVSKVKYTFSKQTYQRVQRGKIRLQMVADNLYDCNYVMFQNTNFGSKWFYAFIVSVEYLNNITSEITFEIDVMQTWWFDHNRSYCYVDRCHTLGDEIGAHIEPEPVTLGEYVFDTYGKITTVPDEMAVIVAISDTEAKADGHLYDGVYGGCTLYAFNADDVAGINAKLAEYIQKPEEITTIYMCPKEAVQHGSPIPQGGRTVPDQGTGVIEAVDKEAITAGTALQGYVPRNNKLYTYPYTQYNVNNASGQSLSLRYEFFKNLMPKFTIYYGITQPVKVILRPRDYKWSGGNNQTIMNESVSLSDYPMCSWATDAYSAWVAQNSVPLMANAVAQPVKQMARGAMTGGLLGAALGLATGAIDTAYETWQKDYTASIQSDICKGETNNGGSNVGTNTQSFFGGRMTQPYNYLVMIDQFFERFGYTCNRVIIPPINNRPHWTYCKTIDANLTGSVPADDMRKLCEIYNKGITFWNNGDEIGNYALDNRPG